MGPLLRTSVLVRRVVLYRDIRLGVAVDALLDSGLARLVGLDVRCGDGAHRFLPLPACEVRDDHLAVESALVFLERELDFYRRGGRAFSQLRGQPVRVGGVEVGRLRDIVVDEDGTVRRLVAATPEREEELASSAGVLVGDHALRPAV